MHNYTFSLDGVSCNEYGIVLQGPIEFSGRTPNVQTVSIPGRNGDLHIFEGNYKNVAGSARCYILTPHSESALYEAAAWLSKPGYRRLETNDSQSYYRRALVKTGPEEEIRMGLLAPFSLEFDCDPRVFLKSGENPTVMENGGNIQNPGMPSYPMIEITGTGSGTVSVNGTVITINSIAGSLTLDSETQNAYKGLENKNNTIYAPNFPELSPGENGVSWTGDITGVTITPRWWV